MDIHNEPPAQVLGDLIAQNSDTPASRKLAGCAGHSHGTHPCAWCKIVNLDINKPSGYDLNGQWNLFIYYTHLMCIQTYSYRKQV